MGIHMHQRDLETYRPLMQILDKDSQENKTSQVLNPHLRAYIVYGPILNNIHVCDDTSQTARMSGPLVACKRHWWQPVSAAATNLPPVAHYGGRGFILAG